eukprot:TRINITY_DN10472_c0_g1_i1.p1 TRINITY_DN10472_c0_g1~~TRINITY_DN10472_c0_g1_i1.p1  ORF type:complete len:559 (+),score=112.75 TRINITY_DN10472_c0_g1_i1:105-1781(+)
MPLLCSSRAGLLPPTFALICLILLLDVPQVEGCMRGGISPGATAALLGLCVVFSPLIAAGYVGVFGYNVATEGVRRMKRRPSNFIRLQRNKAIRKLGLSKFTSYLDELKTYADENPEDLDKQLEYAAALFISEDYHTAYDVLSSIDKTVAQLKLHNWPNYFSMLYLTGLTNQFLFDYDEATNNFRMAIAQHQYTVRTPTEDESDNNNTSAKMPQFSLGDCYNSIGFAQLMSCLYPNVGYRPNKSQRIETLTAAINDLTAAIDQDSKQGSYYYNRGLCKYYLAVLLEKREPSRCTWLLENAVIDFEAAIQSGTFGTGAEAFAMKAQALTLLGRTEDTKSLVEEANRRDAKVFLVDLNDKDQLRMPWPLPIDNNPHRKGLHDFHRAMFIKPTWCQHCNGVIKSANGYRCSSCNYIVHRKCFPRVKTRNCWNSALPNPSSPLGLPVTLTYANEKTTFASSDEEIEDDIVEEVEDSTEDTLLDESSAVEPDASPAPDISDPPPAEQHIHHFVELYLKKPTWCAHCSKFIKQVFHKHASRCSCGVTIHTNCIPSYMQQVTPPS